MRQMGAEEREPLVGSPLPARRKAQDCRDFVGLEIGHTEHGIGVARVDQQQHVRWCFRESGWSGTTRVTDYTDDPPPSVRCRPVLMMETAPTVTWQRHSNHTVGTNKWKLRLRTSRAG